MPYFWKKGTKYYKLQLYDNLFGFTDIVCSWGRIDNNKGGYKVISCNNTDEINRVVSSILKRRKYRGYSLTSSLCDV